MRTGRPAKASTIYKVSIHDNGGRKYASPQPFTVDDDGKKHYTHKHWGIVDDDMRFHPNSTYFYAPIEERRKLIFPAEWDLSEIKALCGTGHRGAVEYEGGDLDRMYGPTWFLDNVARETGLTDDLRKVFDGNMEMAQDALTLAYYLLLESRTYSHIEKWQRVVSPPCIRSQVPASRDCRRISQSRTGWLFSGFAPNGWARTNTAPWTPRRSPPMGSTLWTSAGDTTRSTCRSSRHWKSSCTPLRRIFPSTIWNFRATCPTAVR